MPRPNSAENQVRGKRFRSDPSELRTTFGVTEAGVDVRRLIGVSLKRLPIDDSVDRARSISERNVVEVIPIITGAATEAFRNSNGLELLDRAHDRLMKHADFRDGCDDPGAGLREPDRDGRTVVGLTESEALEGLAGISGVQRGKQT